MPLPDEIVPIEGPYHGFLLQIVRPDGSVVRIPAGGPLEVNLIELCILTITARGVGIGRTTARVQDAIRQGMRDALMSYKVQASYASSLVHPTK